MPQSSRSGLQPGRGEVPPLRAAGRPCPGWPLGWLHCWERLGTSPATHAWSLQDAHAELDESRQQEGEQDPSQDQQAVRDHVQQQKGALNTWLSEWPKVTKSQEKKVSEIKEKKREKKE
ncbi:uncharacterized protein LJ264_007138 [Porphyrio hochstetteri]